MVCPRCAPELGAQCKLVGGGTLKKFLRRAPPQLQNCVGAYGGMHCAVEYIHIFPVLMLTLLCMVLTVRSLLSINEFTLVLEEDGSSVQDDVMSSVISEHENIGTLMVLKTGESWEPAHTSTGESVGATGSAAVTSPQSVGECSRPEAPSKVIVSQ